MCGIIGIISGKDVVVDLIKGLSKLERLRVHLTNFASDKVFEFKIVD